MAMALSPRCNTAEIIDNMDVTYLLPGSQYLVEITHINDPRSFYVRLIAFSQDLKILQVPGNRITSDQVEIKKRVIYKSKILKRYVRGEIEFVRYNEESFTCTIFAIDYGCNDVHVLLEHIYLPASMSSLYCPSLAIHCQLSMCEPKGPFFDEAAIDAMKFFVGKHTAKMTVVLNMNGKLTIRLKTVECPDDVATMLALLHFTTLTNGPNTVNRFYNAPYNAEAIQYKYKAVNVGDRLAVRVQSGSTIKQFYVADLNDYKKYIQDALQFTDYCKLQPKVDIEAAIADSRCCGIKLRRTNQFERGYVLKQTKPGKALTKLIDWGQEAEVLHEDIRYAPSKVYNILPAIAIYCSSTEDQLWETGLPMFLYPGYQFTIEIIEVGDGVDAPHKVNISPMLIK